jgi:hypothetical protein
MKMSADILEFTAGKTTAIIADNISKQNKESGHYFHCNSTARRRGRFSTKKN